MMIKLRDFLGNTSGATSIEYAVIAGFIAVLVIAGARSIGTRLATNYYGKVSNGLS